MNEWISVDERLPSDNEDVLIYVDIIPGRIRTAYLVRRSGKFYDFGTRRNGKHVQPTHWMPLPAPPK